MAKKYECSYCGNEFNKSGIDWEGSDPDGDELFCKSCSESLQQAGINSMDPMGNGYDDDGFWDEDSLGF